MKKILASCLTCCALLGSMCFSSPLAQLHAMSTEGGTATGSTTEKFDHDIELNVNEEEVRRVQTIQEAAAYDIISVTGLDLTEYKLDEDKTLGLQKIENSNTKFEVGSNDISHQCVSYVDTTGKNSIQEYYIEINRPAYNRDFGIKYDVDLSQKENYTPEVKFTNTEGELPPLPEIKVKVTSSNRIVPHKTTAKVKPGDTFRLTLPGDFTNNQKFLTKYLELGKDTEHDYIIWDKVEPNDITIRSLTGKISDDATPGETVAFEIDARIAYSALSMGDDTTTLVTYNAPGDGDGGEENPPVDETPRYSIPVEFKIVDDGQGDIVDDGEEYPVFLNLTPEYKKLTEKGETFKLDASVEIDEDADAEAKASFEKMKKDGIFKISFVSRDTGVATVAEDGTVTAVANGSTEILAYVEGSEDELFATSKVDVEIPVEVEEVDSTYPKTGDNLMAISAAILTLGLSALVVALMSKKKKDVNEEK